MFLFNPLQFSGFSLSAAGGGNPNFLTPVDTELDLPVSGLDGQLIVVKATEHVYIYSDALSKWIDTGLTEVAFSARSNDNGIVIGLDSSGSIVRTTIQLTPADATNPGGVSTTTQSFAGDKTFLGAISASNLSGTNTGDVTLTAVGSSPNSNAASLSGQALTLQPANGTNPGVLTAGTQTIGGDKTFTGSISAANLSGTNTGDQTITLTSDVTGSGTGSITTTVQSVGGSSASDIHNAELAANASTSLNTPNTIVKRDASGNFAAGTVTADLDKSAGTLSVGTTASTINLGGATTTVNITGTVVYENTTNLNVKDPLITLNKNGGAGSAASSGIELEEAGSATGYAKTSADRNSWILKAPNTAGDVTLTPGAGGIIINQSSHDPVSLGTSNGLSLSTQQLSLGTASATTTGALTSTDWSTFNNKQEAGSYITGLTGDVTATGPGSVSATVNSVGGSSASNVHNAELAANAATSLNTASTIVKRDASGNFAAGTVTGQFSYSPSNPSEWSPSPSLVSTALDQLADRFVSQDQITNEPTGFPNRDDSEILISDGGGNPTFTIQPKAPATSYDVYIRGQKYTKSSPLTVTSVSHPGFPYAGNNYFYFDQSGNLQVTNTFTAAIIQLYAFIAIVYWNPDTNSHTYFAEERHGLTMDGATHSYLHTVFGARFLSGLALQNFTIGTGGANADAQFNVDQGSLRDEDILHELSAQAQIPILYRQGSNGYWRKKTADSFPVIYSGTAGYTGANGRLPYNQYSGGSWSLTEVDNNKYVLVHFFGTNDKENGVVGIQGPAEYDSMEAARTAANAEISSLSGLPFEEFVPIGTVVFQTSNTFANTPKADVIPINGANYIDFRGTQLYTPAGTATTHGLLSGLANDDHLQYLLVSGTRAMSGALNMGTHLINNVVDPSLAQDAATKNYVDNGLAGKQPTGNYITALTGDVAASGPGSASSTIQSNTVSNSKLAQMPANTIKGNNTAGLANAVDLTVTQVNSMLGLSNAITGIGTIDSQTPSSNGAVDASNQLVLQSASATVPGLVNTTTQTFAGAKTFTSTITGTTTGNTVASAGDIAETSFTFADNQSSAASITGFAFNTSVVRGFEAVITIVRGSTYSIHKLMSINKGGSFSDMSQEFVGDTTGVTFSITSAGQIQYTSTNTGSGGTIKFRANTLSV